MGYIRSLRTTGLGDVALVGGKTASLGELSSLMGRKGLNVPDGFAVTAAAYRDALETASCRPRLSSLLQGLEHAGIKTLADRARRARRLVYDAANNDDIRTAVVAAYRDLEKKHGRNITVAVRSSATAEDLPQASFAGQHDSFINVRGETAVFEAFRRCLASLFTDRAIVYRNQNGFDHMQVALSVAVMKMVRSDLAASGVIFTLDSESGFRDVVVVTAGYGLGENIVQGRIDPDEFCIHKSTFRNGFRSVLRHRLGRKQSRLVFVRGSGRTTRSLATRARDRARYCITDAEVLILAQAALEIEEHYSRVAGHPVPMDIEWAKDGNDGKLYIVQARPETVTSQRAFGMVMTYALAGKSAVLASGRAVGEKIATGRVKIVKGERELERFRPGEILVAQTTTPDWEPVMKRAAGIVTARGGRTCHAAIVAREMGIPAVVGVGQDLKKLKAGSPVTVCCAEGETGRVYQGALAFKTAEIRLSELPRPKTRIMVNLGDPDTAFHVAMMPNDGVGLARMEFIINQFIGIHPMALARLSHMKDAGLRRRISAMTGHRPREFFIERLAEGVGVIAAAFHPKPVIVRLSDFKTNEYAGLIGGGQFEPVEENPMLGFRGASRYAHPAYAAGFALECAALRRVRDVMGLTNVKVMVPFCRREEEAAKVLSAMAANGLARGQNGLEVFVMCEIPNNVVRIDGFARWFDGFSIGSNDLTQLTLGVDRDSDIVAFDFDERDPGMTEMFRLAVTGAHRNHRHIGICGEAPATYPEVARQLAQLGIDSISVNPSSLVKTFQVVADAEEKVSSPSVAAASSAT